MSDIKQSSTVRIGTFSIAESFGRRHEQVLRLVKKYRKDFEAFNALQLNKVKTKGRPLEEFLLDENQLFFLGMLLKNNKQTVNFKFQLVKRFCQSERQG